MPCGHHVVSAILALILDRGGSYAAAARPTSINLLLPTGSERTTQYHPTYRHTEQPRNTIADIIVNTVEAESAPAGISLVWSHVLGRGSLPLRPELPPVVHSTHERLTRRLDLLLHNVEHKLFRIASMRLQQNSISGTAGLKRNRPIRAMRVGPPLIFRTELK
jgi:hypothetical protein